MCSDFVDSVFHAGQVWRYATRPSEPRSTILILKVEWNAAHGVILHTRVDDVYIRSSRFPMGCATTVYHLPFARDAVERSVTECVEGDIRDVEIPEGYYIWRQAMEAGRAGIFDKDIAEVLQSLEE
jgi:hypothetical protein